MKKLGVVLGVLILMAAASLVYKDKLVDMYEDYKAKDLIEKCFFLNRGEQTIGGFVVAGYDATTNMVSVDGIVLGFLPFNMEVNRDAFKQAMVNGEVVQVSCETGDVQ